MSTNTPTRWYSIRRRNPVARAAQAAAGDANVTSAEVLIFGDIGESWWGEYVTAKEFITEINALEVDSMTVRINSAGGSVPDGLAIYNALKRHPAHVTTVNDGMAMSIASLILMAGDTVEMAENSLLMIHAPWTYAGGNAVELRNVADMLDKWSQAMSASYAAKTGRPQSEMLAWLTDGQDHYFTATEASTEKLVDSVISAMPIAAMAGGPQLDPNRYRAMAAAKAGQRTTPAAPAASSLEITPMPQAHNPAGNTQQPAADAAAIAAQALAAESERRNTIAAAFKPFAHLDGVQALMDQCRDDMGVTAQQADAKLLAHLGKASTPLAGSVQTIEDEGDKRRKATAQALAARAGIEKPDTTNPVRGDSLYDMARASLTRAGFKFDGMDKMQIVGAAFTHSTSDFTNLLANVANKAMLKGVEESDETFKLWTSKGTLSDFKPSKRVSLNAFGSLPTVREGGEYTLGTIGDRGQSIMLAKYGRLFNITREAIINDDIDGFTKIPRLMGRAAMRTVGDAVYALLTGNTIMDEDGLALFENATHKNLLTGATINTASVDAMRVAMALQKAPGQTSGGSNIRLAYLLVPVALEGLAKVVRDSEFEVGAATKNNTTPNIVNGIFEPISDARLDAASATAWYGAASSALNDTIEVSYLDGNELPTLDQQEGWTVDGTQFKVRMEAGTAALDFRALAKNPGA